MAFSDAAVLAGDPTFQGRVGAALFTYCVQTILSEGYTAVWHRERSNFAQQIFTATLNASGINPWQLSFSLTVACDTTVLSDATANSTVSLTTSNRATQQALVTDTHISNAVASQFDLYLRLPQS